MNEITPLLPVRPKTEWDFTCDPDVHGYCPTCSDEAKLARVLALGDAIGLAIVEIDGEQTEIDVSLVADVEVGQVLLMHGGVALEKLEL